MKRGILFFWGILLCISMAACGIEDAPVKATNSAPSQQETKTEATFGLNETAKFKALTFTATEIKESGGDGFFTPESGNVFVGVRFTIENISDEEQSVSSLLLFEGYADDVKCDYSFNAACAFSDGQLDGTIAPGKKLVGWYAVEVPENWKQLELNVQSSWLASSAATFVFTK